MHHIIAAAVLFSLAAAVYSGILLFSYRTELDVEDPQVKGILAPWQFDEAAEDQPLEGEKLFSAETVKSLQLDVMQAEISVISWNEPKIYIAYSIAPRTEDSAEDIYIDMGLTGERLGVSTQIRPNSSFTGSVKYQIRIPDSSTQMELPEIRIYGAGGNILLQNIPEPTRISADTVTGSIDMEGGRNAVLKTIQGNVRFAMPAAGDITVKTGRGSVYGILKTAKPADGSLTVQSDSGNIQLDLPESLQANFDIQSNEGRISSQFSDVTLQQAGENRFAGRRGEGDFKLFVYTNSGDVSIF